MLQILENQSPLKISFEDLKFFNNIMYKAPKIQDDLLKEIPDTWSFFCKPQTLSANELHAMAFVREIDGKNHVLISFRGTKANNLNDLKDDFSIALGFSIPRAKIIKNFACDISEQLKAQNIDIKDCVITTTGHSLGGAHAQFMALELNSQGLELPYVQVIDAPGFKANLLDAYNKGIFSGDLSQDVIEALKQNDGVIDKFHNIVGHGNPVNMSGKHLANLSLAPKLVAKTNVTPKGKSIFNWFNFSKNKAKTEEVETGSSKKSILDSIKGGCKSLFGQDKNKALSKEPEASIKTDSYFDNITKCFSHFNYYSEVALKAFEASDVSSHLLKNFSNPTIELKVEGYYDIFGKIILTTDEINFEKLKQAKEDVAQLANKFKGDSLLKQAQDYLFGNNEHSVAGNYVIYKNSFYSVNKPNGLDLEEEGLVDVLFFTAKELDLVQYYLQHNPTLESFCSWTTRDTSDNKYIYTESKDANDDDLDDHFSHYEVVDTKISGDDNYISHIIGS
jgi:hypothetical protein